MKIEFTVPGQPQGKGRARVSTFGGFARAYTPEKTQVYENLIKVCYLQKNFPKLQGVLNLTVTAVYLAPTSFSLKKLKKALNGEIRPQTKPDLDNILKVVCDALNKIAYDDDKQIVQMFISKYYGENPYIKIEIEEVESDGNQ